jgi:putative ubiquitin-RnfH superfamily antitoxin RatB of RatAB toxin-antitoxin module
MAEPAGPPPGAAAHALRILVVYAGTQGAQQIGVAHTPGQTLYEAVRASGILQRCPDIDLARMGTGVWGRLRGLDTVLAPGDRVEIYRPLVADPKASRSQRARKRAATTGAQAGRR